MLKMHINLFVASVFISHMVKSYVSILFEETGR